jgi:hypothetical protein
MGFVLESKSNWEMCWDIRQKSCIVWGRIKDGEAIGRVSTVSGQEFRCWVGSASLYPCLD